MPRILVIDDDHTFRKLMRFILVTAGYDVQEASDGKIGIACYRQEPSDVVLTDILMPEKEGLETIRELRHVDPQVKIIAMSSAGEGRSGYLDIAVKFGARRILHKPFSPSELLAAVTEVLATTPHTIMAPQPAPHFAALTSALQHERARPERILLELDTEGRITRINQHACGLLGWTEPELVGREWIERCLPPSTQPALRRKFSDLLGGDLSLVQNPVVTRSGDERMIEWLNILVRDEAGAVIGTYSSGADITERSRALEALRAAEERRHFTLASTNATMTAVQEVVNQLANGAQLLRRVKPTTR